MLRSILSAAAAVAVSVLFVAPPAEARIRHRHRAVMRAAPQGPVATAGQPFMYYPQDIEGGVTGNLPFNNQIRKHTDPLNANGGR